LNYGLENGIAMDDKYRMDRKFRIPRIWSNDELKKFSPLFTGDVVNVSAWQDLDKEGLRYRDYFKNASSYSITNYKSEARGFQGFDNEIFLDLTSDLPQDLTQKFNVVFNHTVLEHVYHVHKAFSNLCLMSKDIVIIVVPFLQEMHGEYGDYWRFTPSAVKNMFEENGLKVLYSSFNSHPETSVYLFFIGSKNAERWKDKIGNDFSYLDPNNSGDGFENFVGCHAISNDQFKKSRSTEKRDSLIDKLFRYLKNIFKKQ
jgi:hypothetical protein